MPLASGSSGQPDLWSLGISGDLPIILVRISDIDQLNVAREALQAVEYWRMKRLAVDLVILNERATSYVQDLQIALETLVRASQSRPQIGEERPPGHIFMLRADLISPEARALLASVARVVLVGERGSLADQLERALEARPSPRAVARRAAPASELQVSRPAPGVEYFNGLGGFAEGGREYVTILGPGQSTPAPVDQRDRQSRLRLPGVRGGRRLRLVGEQPRASADAVVQRPGDRPARPGLLPQGRGDRGMSGARRRCRSGTRPATYVARHGWGYSRFEHTSHGIAAELLEYVAARRSDKDLAADAAQRSRAAPGGCP